MKIGRSAITGRFAPVAKATRESRTHVVETVDNSKDDKGGGKKK